MSSLQRSTSAHIKLLIMLGLVFIADVVLLAGSSIVLRTAGIGPLLLINFECWQLLLSVTGSLLPFGLFVFSAPETLSSNQDTMFRIEFVIDMLSSISKIMHYVHIWKANQFSISILEMWMFVLFNRTFTHIRVRVRKFRDYLKILNAINNRCVK